MSKLFHLITVVFILVPSNHGQAGCGWLDWLLRRDRILVESADINKFNRQTCWGMCWAISAAGATKSRTGIEISPSLVFKYHLLERIEGLLRKRIEEPSTKIEELSVAVESGNPSIFFNLIAKYGAVPVGLENHGTFEGRSVEGKKALLSSIRQTLQEFEMELNRLNSFQKVSSSEIKAQQEKILNVKLGFLRLLIIDYAGPMPSKFAYRGQQYTPIEFAHEMILPKIDDLQRIVNNDAVSLKSGGREKERSESNIDELLSDLRQLLIEQKETQYISLVWSPKNIDYQTGEVKGPLQPSENGVHGVQLIGTRTGPFGSNRKWIVKNTRKSGRADGLYEVDDAYLREALRSVTVF